MSEENAKDPLNEAAGSTPFQPTEPLPSAQAWKSASAPHFPPQGNGQDVPFAPPQGQQPALGYGQPQYAQGQPYGHGQPFVQPQQYSQPYAQGPQYNQSPQFAPPQAPQGGYYDQRGNYIPPQYNSQSGQGGWNGGQPPQRSRGVPAWAWILLIVALSAIAVGVLFLMGVFNSTSEVAENPTVPASDQPTIPTPSPVPTLSSPAPTIGTPGQKPTVQIQEGAAVVGDWTLEISEYTADMTDALARGFLPSTPNPGNKFIGVKFTFTNNGMAASDPFTDMFFTLMDESLTVTYREEWALDRDDTVVAMDEVGVGKSGSGWVFFEVPRDFSSGVLEIWDFSFDAEDVYLKIG